MSAHCVIVKSAPVQALAKELNRHPAIVAAEVALWQEKQGDLTKFPTATELDAKPSSEDSDVVKAVKGFLGKIGVAVETIAPNGMFEGVAKPLEALVQVVQGSDDGVLTEEAMHMAVELIEQKFPKLYKQMDASIEDYPEYLPTYNLYRKDKNYQNENGKPNLKKIRKEAIGKVLGEYIVQAVQNGKKPAQIEQVKGWWGNMVESLKGLFGSNKLSFDKVVDIVLNDTEALGNIRDVATTEVFYNLSGTEGKGIKELEEMSKEYILDETDPKNTFYLKAGKKLERVTEFISNTFSSQSKREKLARKSVAEWQADKYYKSKQIATTDDIIWDTTGNTVSYQEAVQLFQQLQDKNNARAKIIHATVENFINNTSETRKKLQDLKDSSDVEDKDFRYLTKDYLNTLIVEQLGLAIDLSKRGTVEEDRVGSEITVGSEELGISGTVDQLVEHSNGTYSIIDLKTGKLLSDVNTPEEMNHTENIINDIIRDTKLNKAQMQVMLYAFLIKMNKPEATFRDLKIAQLNGINVNDTIIHNVSIENYLKVLENYFKDKRPEVYESLKSRNMFDYSSYTAMSKEHFDHVETNAETQGMTKTEKIDYLTRKIEIIRLRAIKDKRKDLSEKESTSVKEMTLAVTELRAENSREFHTEAKDLGLLKRWIGNLYEVNHPLVQNFVKLFTDRKLLAQREFEKFKHAHDKLFKPVLDEYYAKYPNRKLLSPKTSSDDGTGLYDFMWKRRTVGETPGYYSNIITEDQVKAGEYSRAQYEYNKWYNEQKLDLWNKTMRVDLGNGLTKEKMWQGGIIINDDWMPRSPLSQEEVAEKYGVLSKENGKQFFRDLTSSFVKEEANVRKRQTGIPVRFTGSQNIILNEHHSMNAQKNLLSFAQATINKKHLDDVESLGQGVISTLKDIEDPVSGKEKYKNTIEWTNDFIKLQLVRDKDEIKLQRIEKGITIAGKKYQWDYERLAKSSNVLVSASSIWLNAGGATFNALMNGLYSSGKALQGSILKKFGMDYDYSISDFISASGTYFNSGIFNPKNLMAGKFWGDKKIENQATDKMHGFIRMMDYDTENFKNVLKKTSMLGAKNRLLSSGVLYSFYSVSEEFSLYTTMISLLKNQKLQNGQGQYVKLAGGVETIVASKKDASSMWDAYEFNEQGEFVYKGPTRGLLSSGEELKGLTTEEITRYRRVSERIFGGYREDEKTAIEGYLLGQMFMKFKKYLPNVLTYNFQGAFEDDSLGKFVPYMQDGSPKIENGMTVYQWQAQVNEGRVRVLARWLYAVGAMKISKDPKYRNYVQNLSGEQRKSIADAAVSVALMFGLMLAGMGVPDEEKEKKWYQRYTRLQQDMIGVNPLDMMRNAQQGLIQAQMMYKMTDATWNFFYKGLIMGERNESGKYVGQIPGAPYLKHKLPFLNVANEFGIIGDEDENFLNRR